MTDNGKYYNWLIGIKGVGSVKRNALLKAFGSAKAIWNADRSELQSVKGIDDKDIINIVETRNEAMLDSQIGELSKLNVQFVCREDELYPNRLRNIYDYPIGLYYRGEMIDDGKPSIAIVGARDCSEYGRSLAFEIGKILGEAGIIVVSGMARGIDKYAHEGALAGGGTTYGVLAGGVDVCYPRENIDLYERIRRNGALISEFPIHTQPVAQLFPIRNRIISGLSDALIVVEARNRSGSLITADAALEQGRTVYVVPGRIGDPLSAGCLWLARQGAQIIERPEQILEDFGMDLEAIRTEKLLDDEERSVYECIMYTPIGINELCDNTEMMLTDIFRITMSLELKGMIRKTNNGDYVRK